MTTTVQTAAAGHTSEDRTALTGLPPGPRLLSLTLPVGLGRGSGARPHLRHPGRNRPMNDLTTLTIAQAVDASGICGKCRKSKKAVEVFSNTNHMDPGLSIQALAHANGMKVPEILSQVEEMMISPIQCSIFTS